MNIIDEAKNQVEIFKENQKLNREIIEHLNKTLKDNSASFESITNNLNNLKTDLNDMNKRAIELSENYTSSIIKSNQLKESIQHQFLLYEEKMKNLQESQSLNLVGVVKTEINNIESFFSNLKQTSLEDFKTFSENKTEEVKNFFDEISEKTKLELQTHIDKIIVEFTSNIQQETNKINELFELENRSIEETTSKIEKSQNLIDKLNSDILSFNQLVKVQNNVLDEMGKSISIKLKKHFISMILNLSLTAITLLGLLFILFFKL